MTSPVLTPEDREQLEAHGVAAEEAERQLGLLTSPPAPPELAGPCTAGDGIARIVPERHDSLVERYRSARQKGRAMKMVPASGAASRMFRTLLPWVDYAGNPAAFSKEVSRRAVAGDPAAGDAVRFLSELERFPFHGELAELFAAEGQDLGHLRRQGDAGAVLHALLSDDRLDYDARPKALIPFHRYPDGAGAGEVRTAFEEQLVEAAMLVADREGRARVHFTVPPEAREAIDAHLAEIRGRLEPRLEVTFDVTFSVQSPGTDTLALDPESGEPFRLEPGELLFRPGGHGALIENLQAVGRDGGDLVFVKNVDNVQPDRVKDEVVRWKEILGGHLLELRERSEALVGRLSEGDPSEVEAAADETRAFLAEHLGVRLPEGSDASAEALIDRLDRPLRVAGMVVNRGEPGGGPFWVRTPDGAVTAQIVERSQVDESVPEQARAFREATHFNPVDLACALRGFDGRPYDLARYVDPRAVFLAEKSHGGRKLLALERPGLWNGAMAGWNTAFVEVPEVTFSPVKTVFDLLRPEHRA